MILKNAKSMTNTASTGNMARSMNNTHVSSSKTGSNMAVESIAVMAVVLGRALKIMTTLMAAVISPISLSKCLAGLVAVVTHVVRPNTADKILQQS